MPALPKHLDWPGFLGLVLKLGISEPSSAGYLWRGQSRDWPLRTRLLRSFGQVVTERKEAQHIEALAVDRFQMEAPLHVDPAFTSMIKSDFGWWCLMAHHGAPTRLLDWTLSPFVAAYFAIRENAEEDGAVWCVPVPGLDAAVRRLYPDFRGKPPEEFVHEPVNDGKLPALVGTYSRRKVPRIVAQQGHFTVSNDVLADHGELLDRLLDGSDEPHGRFLIRAEHKPLFLAELARMNITGGSLFPGVDGLGVSVDEFVTLEVVMRRLARTRRDS